MEEKLDKEPRSHKLKRKVSIFKRRKKADIRPFIRQSRQEKIKKLLVRLFLIFLIILFLSLILFFLRFMLLPQIFDKNSGAILSPTVQNQVKSLDTIESIRESGLDITEVTFSKDFSTVSFFLHKDIKILMKTNKNTAEELKILSLIDAQLTAENKRAILVDLRYNKPIVKF